MNGEYTYYSGANVVVEIEDFPILEVAGLRTSIMESKRPIYGYSSRFFDAVAAGQVLVEGSLLINYVDHNYLFRAIELGIARKGLGIGGPIPPAINPGDELRDQLGNEGNAALLLEQFQRDPGANQQIAAAMKDRIWGAQFASASAPEPVFNPHDSYPGLNLRVTFGDRKVWNNFRGHTSFVLQQVHFLGRGKQIAVSPDVIVEEYPFFARNMVNIRDGRIITLSVPENTTSSTTPETSVMSLPR